MNTVTPLAREIIVPVDPQEAFAGFTERISQWWPVEEKSVFGAGATVNFEGGELVERSPTGEKAVWGTVTRWEPGRVVSFTWHPGYGPERQASNVEVWFIRRDGGTLVRLLHSGWEVFADPSASKSEYGQGWQLLLQLYSKAFSPTTSEEPESGS